MMSKTHFKKMLRCLWALSLVGVSASGCTRSLSNKASITISVPNESSSLSTTDKLDIVIINARSTPGANPKVWEFEGAALGSVSPGGAVSLTIEGDIPNSPGLLIQFLGVFAATDGAMKFSYGDTTVDSTKSGDIVANIVSTTVGASDRMGRVGGRYITSSSPSTSGPTGTLITKFKPPTGQPAMSVQKSDIVNGWFSVMAFNGTQIAGDANFEYSILKDDLTTEVLFAGAGGNLNLTAPVFTGDDTVLAMSTKVDVPPSFRLEKYSPTIVEVRPDPRQEYVVGFFRPSNAIVWPMGARVCYPGSIQSIPELYNTADLFSAAPIAYRLGGSVNDAHEVLNNVVLNNAVLAATPECLDPTKTFIESLNIYVDKINSGRSEVFGMRVPFAVVAPEREHENAFVRAIIDDTSANPKLQLSWKYLPGVLGSGVDGLTVYSKYFGGTSGGSYSDGGTGDDDLIPCSQEALSQGYKVTAEVANQESVTITAPPGHPHFSFDLGGNTGNEITRYGFMLCPYRNFSGVRKYYTDSLEVHCVGHQCNDNLIRGFGNRIPGEGTHDYSSGGDVYFGTISSTKRITAVTNAGSYDISLNVGPMPLVAGDEVIAVVMANHSNDCGAFLGQPISAGMHTYARVVSYTSPNVVIRKGSFLDKMISIGMPMTVGTGASDHCYVQLVKVAQFGNLTINASHRLLADPFAGSSVNGGGVIALKVSGTLTLAGDSAIDATGSGFVGNGLSIDSEGPTAMPSNASTAASLAGGGGAHIGAGGSGGGDSANNATLGHVSFMSSSMMSNGPRIMMGTGGGSSSGAIPGGKGGGAIFINARKIVVTGAPAFIKANGASGLPGSGFAGGGGGGGGSVILNSYLVDIGANSLNVEANGGDGGNSNSTGYNRSGGGGGGGYADFRFCKLATASIVPTVSAAGGQNTGNTSDEGLNISSPGQPGYADGSQKPDYCPPL